MSDATLRQINGVVSKDADAEGPNSSSNLPLIEQLAGGKYNFKTIKCNIIDNDIKS